MRYHYEELDGDFSFWVDWHGPWVEWFMTTTGGLC